MSEKDMNRIERKVDLIFKILLNKYVDYIGHPYDFEYLEQFKDEIISLFDLPISEPDKLENLIKFPSQEDIKKKENELNNEIELFKKGEYLAKDRYDLVKKLYEIKDQVDEMIILDKNREKIKKKYEEGLELLKPTCFYLELREKLNLSKFSTYEIRLRLEYVNEITSFKSHLHPTSWKDQRESILEDLRKGESISDEDIINPLKEDGFFFKWKFNVNLQSLIEDLEHS